MNILEIVILIYIIAMAWMGLRRGFVRKLAAVLSLVLSVTLVSAVLPYVTQFIRERTPLYDYIHRQCRQVVTDQIADTVLFEEERSRYDEAALQDLSVSRIDQTRLIENLPLPESMKDLMLDYNNEEGYRNLAVNTFQDYVAGYIATMILNGISFLAAVILVQLLLRAVIQVLDIFAHIPVIRGINRLAGLLLGLLEALFFIWIFFLILSMFSTTEPGLSLMAMVQESSLLGRLYNSNLFLQVIVRAVSVLTV